MKHCTHKSVMNNDKTPPITSKRALPYLYVFKTLLSTPKKVYYHKGAHKMTNFFIYSKRPPLTSKKKTVPNCAFIQNAPPTSKKVVTTTRSP